MPSWTAPVPPRDDATVQPNVKNVFDRDPLLIPQPFEDRQPRWHRGRSGLVLLALLAAGTAAVAVRFGASPLRALAGILGR
jgi:hypothetical protein